MSNRVSDRVKVRYNVTVIYTTVEMPSVGIENIEYIATYVWIRTYMKIGWYFIS